MDDELEVGFDASKDSHNVLHLSMNPYEGHALMDLRLHPELAEKLRNRLIELYPLGEKNG